MKLATGIATLTLAVASAYSIPANAELELHGNASGPTARCQGALPVFETAIRKRPLAVQNEGTAASFITCSFEVDSVDAIDGAPVLLDTYFSTTNTSPVDITCTAVSGFQGGTNEFVSFTGTINPNAAEPFANLFWLDTDFDDGLASGLISISCNLPAGVGINDSYIWWAADDLTEPTP